MDYKVQSLLCIIAGGIVVFIAVGELFFRIGIALIAIRAINYGLKLQGHPSLFVLVQKWYSKKLFF
jgi:hypothetical protein